MGPHPAVFDWDRDEASSHEGRAASCGTTLVTQFRCHGGSVICESSRGEVQSCFSEDGRDIDRDKDSGNDADTMARTSACVVCSCTVVDLQCCTMLNRAPPFLVDAAPLNPSNKQAQRIPSIG